MDRASSVTSVREPSFEEIFTLSLDLLCIGGLDGYFKRVNPAFEQAFGYSTQELLSRPFLDFVHPDDRARSRDALERLIRGEEVVLLENRNARADGSTLWLQWSARPVPGESFFYAAGHDISDRKRSEDQLRRAKEMVEASRDELRSLAEDQAALRRVATLVAKETPPAELFAKVVEEVANVLGQVECLLVRDEGDGTASVAAARGAGFEAGFPVGMRLPIDGDGVTASVLRTGGPWRTDDYSTATGTLAERAHEYGLRSAVGCPIRVGGRIWGVIGVARSDGAALPPESETRITQFSDLVATAIASAAARTEVEQLAEEQAALRRVATLVARGTSPEEVFAAVAEEVDQLLGLDNTLVYRYEGEDTAAVVAAGGEGDIGVPIGARVTLEGQNVAARVLETGRAARLDDYINATGTIADLARNVGLRCAVGSPIVVEGRLWGAMVAMSRQTDPLPRDTESRIGQFTQLVAMAISNTESRAEVGRLAEEQAALGRVATLVARGVSPTEILDAVAVEAASLLGAELALLERYESDGEATVLASRGEVASHIPAGTHITVERETVAGRVLETGNPTRIGDYADVPGHWASVAREGGVRSAVGAPITVEGRLWGVMIVASATDRPLPPNTTERLAEFAELIATAIANTESRTQLTESRARVLAAGDEARRHVVRDLHDGAQQRLVHTVLTLQLAQRALRDREAPGSLVAEALAQAEQANVELRELAHGILPSVLSRGGLRAGVDALVSRIDLPVTVAVSAERFPPEIEASAYFVVAEALTNAVKHSCSKRAEVRALVDDGLLHVEVRDHGVGGAMPDGDGLVGLDDRVSALGGRLRVAGPPDGGTLIAADLPLPV